MLQLVSAVVVAQTYRVEFASIFCLRCFLGIGRRGNYMVSSERDELTFDRFIELFIAGLVSRGIVTLSPNAAETNLCLYRMSEALSAEAESATVAPEQLRWIRRIRNQLAPSNLGTFDSFFSALRAKQLGYVGSPNPSYKDINFKISPTYAQSLLEELLPNSRKIVDLSVSKFIG